jgi:hypothetical protein
MMTAVWVAVVTAAAFWVIAVCVAVYLMLAGARLITQTTATVASLRQRSEALIDHAEAVTRRADEQVSKARAIADSMDEVTTSMTDLNGRLTELGPAARSLAEGAGLPLSRIAAFVYGVARAVGVRRAAARDALPAGISPSSAALPGASPSAGASPSSAALPGASPSAGASPSSAALPGRRSGGHE